MRISPIHESLFSSSTQIIKSKLVHPFTNQLLAPSPIKNTRYTPVVVDANRL